MGKNNQPLSMLRCQLLELLDKDFKFAIIIMVQEVWLNSWKEWKGGLEMNRGYNGEPSGDFRTEIYNNQN